MVYIIYNKNFIMININKRKDEHMKKKSLTMIIVLLAVIILMLLCVIPPALDIFNIPISGSSDEVLISIDDNTSTLKVGSILEDNKLIRSKFAFLIKVKTSAKNPITSGTHTLRRGMTSSEIIEKLTRPKIARETINITFPEGYTAEQMASLLEDKGIVSKSEFLKALEDEYKFEFLSYIPEADYKYALQGFLFPSTYEFYKDSDAHEIITRMLSHFESIYKENADSYENIFTIITKASLIEKEAKIDTERPTVAGVIENRIKSGMPFQIDASVLYAATDGMYDVTDGPSIAGFIKNLDSPYNTYKYKGLTPGPICNPGLTSIKAAINPEKHAYLYYHTDTSKNDGSHIFTKTYEEHANTIE